ncbi:MAG: glycerol-3-phosphate acyltransferase [Dehalococcoidia bacterium]|nr:glycerol-3-phosphate acyltransferase [Dehalococcoidia bacterium]
MSSVFSIAAGYLLGSVSAAWLITRLCAKVDIRAEDDGRISPASVYYRLGALQYALAAILDILLAAAAVVLARVITHSDYVAMLAGLAAMVGHNWSLFLKFKGGQGATSMAGALAGLVFWPLCIGLLVAGISVGLTRRTTISTAVGVAVVFAAVLFMRDLVIYALYPLGLFSLMLLKRLQLSRAARHKVLSTAK